MPGRADGASSTAHDAAASRLAGLHAAAADRAAAEPAHDDLDRLIGARLRQLRHERRWSLDRLAQQAGVSRAMLGQIELGRSAPTVRVLMRVAAGLGVDVTTLLAPAQPRLHVLRADAAATARETTAPTLRSLGTGQPGAVAFHAMRLPPSGAASYPDALQPCRVNAVVARGTVEVTAGGETLTLGEDDALEADTAAPLRWRNAGDGAALVHAVWSCDR